MNEPKMNTKRVVAALKNWSPNGLCTGQLVLANGEKSKTEACAIGCLTLEFAFSKEGEKLFKKHDRSRHYFIKNRLYGNAGLDKDHFITKGMREYFGLTTEAESEIMCYNDVCDGTKDTKPGTLLRYNNCVPISVQKTIYSLRKKYDKFDDKREANEDPDHE